MVTLVLATRNPHKSREIRQVLGEDAHYLTLADFPAAPIIVEDAPSFAGNAAKKAEGLAAWLRDQAAAGATNDWWVLADDSGLEVDILGGAPGVHSARFAALDRAASGNTSDAENNAKLLRLLDGIPLERRNARFRCVIALAPVLANRSGATPIPSAPVALPSGTVVFEGACEGRLLLALAGQGGFGYDPLFQPNGYDASFGQLGEDLKNRISHRARALAGVECWLRELAGLRA